MLGSDEQRAWYGPEHVSLAADRGAIGTLLISDDLFRSNDVSLRKKYVALVEDVRNKRGEVLIFSSMHESGQRRSQHTMLMPVSSRNRIKSNHRNRCNTYIPIGHRSR